MTRSDLASRLSGLRRGWKFSGHITLGPRALIALGSLALISIGWAFYIGLLVGRDEQPHEAVPGLGEFFRKEKAQETPIEQAQEPDQPAAQPDLPAQGMAQESQAPAMSGEAASAWPPAPTQQAQATAPAAAAEPRKSRLYQIAAFRTSGEAAALAARIRIPGLKTRVEQAGKVFLVIGSGRMSETEDAAMRESLAGMGLGRPLPLSRKAAPQKAATPPAKTKAGAAAARKAPAGAKKQARPAKAASPAKTGGARGPQKKGGRAQ